MRPSGSPSVGPHSPSEFVGRQQELEALAENLRRAADRRPTIVLLSGDAGVGKSRLLKEFRRQTADARALVLVGACVGLGTGELPYAPLIDALRLLVRRLGVAKVRESVGDAYDDLAGTVGGLPADDDGAPVSVVSGQRSPQVRVFGAVLRLLDRLSTRRPAVLVFEDMHWADPSTLDLVRYLAQALSDERVLLVVSYRTSDLPLTHPLRELVAELDLARRSRHVEVQPFTHRELAQFLTDRLGRTPDRATVKATYALAEGNAVFTEELLASNVALVTAGPVYLPGSLKEIVLRRFRQRGDDSQEVMRVAATAGREVSDRLLSRVCELSGRRMNKALRECVDHQMLTQEERDVYRFRHALLREAVHQDTLSGHRRELHAAIATALAADPTLGYLEEQTVDAELSYHWFEADRPNEALAAALRAGDRALRMRAFAEAATQFERALTLWPRADAPARASSPGERLLVSAAEAARWVGRTERAVELIEKAIREVDAAERPSRAGELYERLGSYLWDAGNSAAALDAYQTAADLLAGLPPTAVTVRVHAALATVDVRAGDYTEGLRRAASAIDMADRLGAEAAEAKGRALNTAGVALAKRGRADEGIANLRQAQQIADRAGNAEDLYRAYGNLTLVLEIAGDFKAAEKVAIEALNRARQHGYENARLSAVLANNAGVVLHLTGRWEDASRVIEDIVADRPVAETLYPRLTLAEMEVARGNFAAAEAALELIGPDAAHVTEPGFVGSLYACMAELALWQGRPAAAREAADTGISRLGDTESVVEILTLDALAARAMAEEIARLDRAAAADRRGAVDELRRAVEAVQRRHGSAFVLEARALHQLCLAECDRALHHPVARERRAAAPPQTASRWAEVVRLWDDQGRPYPAAYARWRQAEAELAQRNRQAAVDLARRAHSEAGTLGAVPLRAAIEIWAAANSVRLDRPVVPAQRRPPTEGLTKREWEVLEQLCTGQRDAEIGERLHIATKTVSTHVSHILTKLNVANRNVAANFARDRNWFPRGSQQDNDNRERG
jgi:ATP/maltotriose-dependent transcriptional regulator MalT